MSGYWHARIDHRGDLCRHRGATCRETFERLAEADLLSPAQRLDARPALAPAPDPDKRYQTPAGSPCRGFIDLD
jgi:hypothetical protein